MAIVFDYAAIARRMNCDKPTKREEPPAPTKKKFITFAKSRAIAKVGDDDDVDDD